LRAVALSPATFRFHRALGMRRSQAAESVGPGFPLDAAQLIDHRCHFFKHGVEKRVAIFFGALHKLGFDFVYRTRSKDASLGLPMDTSDSSIDKTTKQSSGASPNNSAQA
jgi:hypothetical protein